MKRIKLLSSGIVLMLGAFLLTSLVSAADYKFKWNTKIDVNTGRLVLKYYVGSGFPTSKYTSSIIEDGAYKWWYAGAQISFIPTTSASYSDVDIYALDFSDNGWGSNTYAWAQMYRNDGVVCNGNELVDPDVTCGNKIINYGAIYVNREKQFTNSDKKKALFAHELAHTAGMGHQSYLSGSIMYHDLSGGTEVTAFDVSQTKLKYPVIP